MTSLLLENWIDILMVSLAGISVITGLIVLKRLSRNDLSMKELHEDGRAQSDTVLPPCLSSAIVEVEPEKAGSNTLQLSVVNIGQKLIFRSISIQENNELEVDFEELYSQTDPEYPTGKPIMFKMIGDHPENSTYHFRVIYSDQNGNTYSQGIAGWGKESPIIEPPLQIVA